MLKSKHLITTLIFFLLVQLISSQSPSVDEIAKMDSTQRAEYLKTRERKIDSLSTIDYLSYKYKYLDKDFSIEMSPRQFRKTMKKYDYVPQAVDSYKDSLSVALMGEFNDWDKAHIAKLKISYSWLRLGYHTWQTAEAAKDFAAQFGITHPYRMREFLVDEENTNPTIVEFIDELRLKVEKETGKDDLGNLCREELLHKALRANPERIKAFKKRQEEVRRKRQQAAHQ